MSEQVSELVSKQEIEQVSEQVRKRLSEQSSLELENLFQAFSFRTRSKVSLTSYSDI